MILINRTILITGASAGLGWQIARTMWQAGASLRLVARSAERLEERRSELAKTAGDGQTVEVIPADLSQPDAIDTISQHAGAVDVLVNNAAVQGPIGPVWENDWEAWQAALTVDLLAPVALCRACLPGMITRGYGKIINVSGGGATGPRPNFSAYAVAKTGLVRFTESLAHEVKSYHIDVNAIAPGVMRTQMTEAVIAAGAALAGEKEYAGAQKVINDTSDAARDMMRPAELCVFLASSASDGISGKLISAVWDPWESLPDHRAELAGDVYTLRRIVPKERGMDWGERE